MNKCNECKMDLEESEKECCKLSRRGNVLLKKYENDLHNFLNFTENNPFECGDTEITGLYVEESCIGDALVHLQDDCHKHYAWCECGDALQTREIKDKKGMITGHEYYCIGCDVTYRLEKKC